jgi:hypothetical protein
MFPEDRLDKGRDQRIMELAKILKVQLPHKTMKLCILEAIRQDQEKRKLNEIFK